MGSANLFSINSSNAPKSESDILKQYHCTLVALEFEHGIKISHNARIMHVDFFKTCLSYEGNLHGMQDYLLRNDYDLVYNIGLLKLDEIIEKEKDKIAKGEYLLGALFSPEQELLRYIIGKRDILLTKIFNKVKNEVRNLGQTPCRQ